MVQLNLGLNWSSLKREKGLTENVHMAARTLWTVLLQTKAALMMLVGDLGPSATTRTCGPILEEMAISF